VEDPLLKDDKLEDIQAISDSGILKLSKNTEKKEKNLYSTLGVGVCCSGSVTNSSASHTFPAQMGELQNHDAFYTLTHMILEEHHRQTSFKSLNVLAFSSVHDHPMASHIPTTVLVSSD
ncbi:hypothetical protein Tco_0637062, partial [Tanacetum coccineum]